MTLLKFKQQELPANGREKFRNFPELFNDLFDNMITTDFRRSSVPGVNIVESNDNFRLEMAAPGLNKEDFKINLDNEVLTISTEKKSEEKESNEKYTRREFSYSSFLRSFNLPETIDAENIAATYENGVLKVVLPKKEEAKPKAPREVKIA